MGGSQSVRFETAQRRTIRIKPGRRSLARELRELWAYRELFGFLVWRDLKVRYVQTILGPLWAIMVPIMQTVLSPFFLLLAVLSALGIGLWLSALNVRYHDVPYLMPVLTQFWLFASPVLYGTSFIPPRWHWLIALNPITGVIDGFRWAVLG